MIPHSHQAPTGTGYCITSGGVCGLSAHDARRCEARQEDRAEAQAFFPGYLVLHLAPEERKWVAISSVRVPSGLIYLGDHYVPVLNWIIVELEAKEDASGAVPLVDRLKKRLAPVTTVAV